MAGDFATAFSALSVVWSEWGGGWLHGMMVLYLPVTTVLVSDRLQVGEVGRGFGNRCQDNKQF